MFVIALLQVTVFKRNYMFRGGATIVGRKDVCPSTQERNIKHRQTPSWYMVPLFHANEIINVNDLPIAGFSPHVRKFFDGMIA